MASRPTPAVAATSPDSAHPHPARSGLNTEGAEAARPFGNRSPRADSGDPAPRSANPSPASGTVPAGRGGIRSLDEVSGLTLVEEYEAQCASLPTITLTDEQVAWVEATIPANRSLALERVAQEQHWNWWADFYAKRRCQVLSAWHMGAPKVTQHFIDNREALVRMAQAAFDEATEAEARPAESYVPASVGGV